MRKKITALLFIFFILAPTLQAGYDPSWKWQTLKNDQFTIYYPEGYEETAYHIYGLSNQVYDSVNGYLGVEPRNCPVVINPGTDLFNGFYSPLPNRISLYETPLANLSYFGPDEDPALGLFIHEYAHFSHITMRLGWYDKVCTLFGDGLAVANGPTPGWVNEGVTTYSETTMTDGGRGRSAEFTGMMRSFDSDYWNLSSAGTFSPYAPPGGRIYLAGYHMLDYMNQAYGQDAFARLARYQARHPLTVTEGAIRKELKVKPEEFYAGFLSHMQAQVDQHKAAALASGLPQGRVLLSYELDGIREHFWDAEGRIIAVRSGYAQPNALLEINPLSGEIFNERALGNLNANHNIRRLSCGQLAYGGIYPYMFDSGDMDVSDLTLLDPETRRHTRLTRNKHIFSADLSPNQVSWVATRRQGRFLELVLLDRAGQNARTLISGENRYFEAPTWSPDGEMIAVVVKEGRNADIALVDPSNGDLKRLYASDLNAERDPSFSPDGRYLLFISDRTGTFNVYAWDLQTEELYQLTSVFYAASNPQLSPDGQTLSFLSLKNGLNQLCSIPFNLNMARKIEPSAEPAPANQAAIADLRADKPAPAAAPAPAGIPLGAYKPFLHTPYLTADEDGAALGVFLMGADPVGLNKYNLKLYYGSQAKRFGYDLNYTNSYLWPDINFRLYDSALEGNTLGGGKDHWFREIGTELSLSLPYNLRYAPSYIGSNTTFGTRYRHFGGLDGFHVDHRQNESVSLFSSFSLSHSPNSAKRDMRPIWGQNLMLAYENSLDVGEISGHNFITRFSQYLPSFIDHHAVELGFAFQGQRGPLTYSKVALPRGYGKNDRAGGMYKRKNLKLTAEYHFPIAYPDAGWSTLIHFSRVQGSLFLDYGAGWQNSFSLDRFTHDARTSIGLDLSTETEPLGSVPFEVGLTFGYMCKEQEGFINYILKF